MNHIFKVSYLRNSSHIFYTLISVLISDVDYTDECQAKSFNELALIKAKLKEMVRSFMAI